ncbi:hypothetical protein QA596_05075 [Balneolales bacterium ANBcel1]|nr:hypothetical protein [Balneolales bacterium ANBcel1]
MLYQDKFYYLCHIPLSAEGPDDVEIIERAANSRAFSELFKKYEELRSHAFNEDGLYSVVRADDIYVLIRTTTSDQAKSEAYDEARPGLITNLEHRVMQQNDKNAAEILRNVHDVDLSI